MNSLWWWLIGGLSLMIAAEWFLPAEEPAIPSYAAEQAAQDNKANLLAQADRTLEFPTVEQFQSVSDRPLFFEGRRPPAEYVPEAPKAKPERPARKVPPPRASLSGVVRIGDQTYVMLKGVGKARGVTRVRVGDDVDGWKVERIQDDRVVLKNGEEKHEIPLRAYKAVALPKPKPKKKPGAKPGANKAKNDKAAARKKALAARRAARKKEQ